VQIKVVNDPADAKTIGFTADTGLGTAGKAVLSKAGKDNPSVFSILGDLAYQNNMEQAFCDQVNTRVLGPKAIIVGNHEDTATDPGAAENYVKCLPATYPVTGDYLNSQYYYDVGAARVIMINPNVKLPGGTKTYAVGTPERDWLVKTIQDAKAAGKWTIVGMHYSCFSLGAHACNESTPNVPNLAISLGVDLFIAGHDHIYSRTNQLKGTYSSPSVVDRDNDFAAGAGTVFPIVGNGGYNPRSVGAITAPYAVVNGSNSSGGSSFGYGNVLVTPDRLTWTYVPAYGNMGLTDSFTITR
jgi:3',5'-cyclic AMP phosphodiesterase CpdA